MLLLKAVGPPTMQHVMLDFDINDGVSTHCRQSCEGQQTSHRVPRTKARCTEGQHDQENVAVE
jgi:hypothetical protein